MFAAFIAPTPLLAQPVAPRVRGTTARRAREVARRPPRRTRSRISAEGGGGARAGDAEQDEPRPQLPGGSASGDAARGTNDLGFVGNEKLGISFVCDFNACGTRISKTIKRRSYERGTVVVQCPACGSHHVIADNFGMYSQLTGGRRNIEEIAEAQGQPVTRVGNDVFNLEKLVSDHVESDVAESDDASEKSEPGPPSDKQ